MEYVNRRETGESKNERPFYVKQKVGTIRKYTDVWVKILRYIWRTSQCERETRPKYTFTSNQQKYLHRMRRTARKIADKEEEEVEEGGRVTEAKGKEKRNQAIEERCLEFWIAMFDHGLGDSEYDSAIISGIAVLGLDTENKGWAPAENFTPKLSAIVTIVRAIVVYTGHSHRQKTIQRGIEDGLS